MKIRTPLEQEAFARHRANPPARAGGIIVPDNAREVKRLAGILGVSRGQVRALRCRGLLETPPQQASAARMIDRMKRTGTYSPYGVAYLIAAAEAASGDEDGD